MPKMSRASLSVFMFSLAASSVSVAEIPEPFLPEGVTFGMTCDTVQAIRPKARKPQVPILPFRAVWPQLAKDGEPAYTDIATLSEVAADKNPIEIWEYYFSDRKLASVMYSSAYYSIPSEDGTPLFQGLRDVLDKHFKKQADERVTRLSGIGLRPETRQVESWSGMKGEVRVLFEAESNAVRCVIYDPRVFSLGDFYLSENDIEALAPAIQAMREAQAKSKAELEKTEKARDEERRNHQKP